MKEYKAYLFDLDLTALNTVESSIITYINSFKKIGATFDKDTILHQLSVPISVTYNEIESKNGSLEDFINHFNYESEKTFKDSFFYEDTLKYFDYLYSKNKIMGIITNRTRNNITDILDKYNLKNMFKVTVSCDDVKNIKPSPDPMLKALERLGLKPSEVVYFGDTINDLIACQKTGIDFIKVNRYNLSNFNSDYSIKSFDEIERNI